LRQSWPWTALAVGIERLDHFSSPEPHFIEAVVAAAGESRNVTAVTELATVRLYIDP
jgi:hypothetical protein